MECLNLEDSNLHLELVFKQAGGGCFYTSIVSNAEKHTNSVQEMMSVNLPYQP